MQNEAEAQRILSQIVEHHLGLRLDDILDKDLSEVDADILTNLLNDIDETFFGDIGDDAHWESVYTGTGDTMISSLMGAWEGDIHHMDADNNWIPPEERAH